MSNHYLIRTIVVVILSFSSLLVRGQVTLEKHEDLNLEALRFWYSDPNKPSHIFNRNISPKGDCIQEANGFLFFTWFKGGMNERNLMLSRLNIATDEWVTIQFPDKSKLYQGVKNGVDITGAGDSHRETTVGVSAIDGTIHLVYDMHSDRLNYRVSNKNIAFAPASEFTINNFSPKRDYFKPGKSIGTFTYPSFETNNMGELILEYRLGTSRQGDKYLLYYDGNQWSDYQLVMKGNNENPEFNQYGGFRYFFDQLYMGSAVRIKDSPIEFNQGMYFARVGQRGTGSSWQNLEGQNFNTPVIGLNQMDNFKIASPLPNGHNGMTGSPAFVVSKNGAVHFTARINGEGTVHYHTEVGSDVLIKAPGGSSNVNFPADDGRVYSMEIVNGNIRVKSTQEGQHNWRTDYLWNGSQEFGLMSYEYSNGKIHIIASEDVDTDKLPLHYIVLNIAGIVQENQNPIVAVTSPLDNAVFNLGETIDLGANASDVDGTIDYVNFKINDGFYSQDNSEPYFATFTPTEAGTYKIAAEAFDNDGATSEQYVTITVVEPEVKEPYLGQRTLIPGTLEAENYDKGGQGVSYNDADPENRAEGNFRATDGVDAGSGNDGLVIGYTAAGEWLEYMVDIEESGSYDLEITSSSLNGTGVLGIELDGQMVLSGSNVPSTNDWDGYDTYGEVVALIEGEHVLRLNIENAGFNLDKMVFTKRIPCAIIPYININNNGWNEISDVEVVEGDNVWFGPQSNLTGSTNVPGWSWSGPENFTYSGRSHTVEDVSFDKVGDYTVSFVNDNGCNVTHDFTISLATITATDEFDKKDHSVSVYPNPSSTGVFQLSAYMSWAVFNAQGTLIDAGKGLRVDLSGRHEGVYFLNTESDSFKLIVK